MNDATSSTLDTNASVTTVPVHAQRRVSYEFDTKATRADLAIPYVVIVNGKVQGPDKPRRLSRENRKIAVTVEAGSKVALYLNSDVHPNHRRNPVYEVTVNDKNVSVKITEKTGNDDPDPPTLKPVPATLSLSPDTDFYTAKLTGNIWMTISHRYTEAEANALLPANTDPVVRKAVCSIYRGLGVGKLDIPLRGESGVLHVSFINQGNPQANISRCSLSNDVLPRTHPWAFMALFDMARDTQLSQLHITSCWRPSLGSIAHRAGLGIDIDVVATSNKRININRVGLTVPDTSDNPNITTHEKELLAACTNARLQEKLHRDKEIREAAKANCDSWENEVEKNEPQLIRSIRRKLQALEVVEQILDPWYIELNTKDSKSQKTNAQSSDNERIHKDHLHITIKDAKIYD
ncbi:hypothetical protein [Duganella levis]|uniref:Uncharacterized protein n=1 Tax=Duganella levis TaxID=2692169 RepID=A0ABW9W007_9BURK|nr:hypothetical protein [Duganella levis]MYN27205.1 hypothetical protein [Duganella levis]